MDPLWIVLGSAGYFSATLLQSLRFKLLVHSRVVSLPELFRISIFYNLSNMILPSRLGELSYPYLLNKIGGLSITEGLASLITSRVYDFTVLLIFFLLSAIGFQSFFTTRFPLTVVFICLLIGITLSLFFYMNRILIFFSNQVRKVSERMGTNKGKTLQWVQRKMYDTAEDFHAIRSKGIYLRVTLTSLFLWMLIFFVFYAFLRGFGIELSLLKVIFGSGMGVVAGSIPVSGLGNWGTLEAGWTAGFLIVGLSMEEAIATGFAVHILMFSLCALAALISWASLVLSPNKEKQ